MSKAWCVWCESQGTPSSSGYYWIHPDCAEELMDVSQDIKNVKEMLKGTHPRNKKDKNKLNVILNYIKDIEKSKKRWDGSMKIIKEVMEHRK